jgi:polar amino acid transport system substrate-binding protein
MKFAARALLCLACAGLLILILQSIQPNLGAWAQTSETLHMDPAALQPDHPDRQVSADSLRGGWIEARPFQWLAEGQLEGPQGLDVGILADALRLAGMEAHLRKQAWSGQLADLIEGRADIALGAFKPADGDDRFHYSAPYRWARISLFVRAGDEERYRASNILSLLSDDRDFRIGAIEGRLFEDPELNRSIERAVGSGRVVHAHSDEDNLRNLVRGDIDGFVADRLGVAATALAEGYGSQIAEVLLPGTSGVHFILSKKTVPAKTLERINDAIASLEKSGQLTKRLHTTIFSVVINYALASELFVILSIIGTVAFAVSGVLIAYRENFSVFGALVLSALPAVGGGALRDLLFNRHPMAVISDPIYLMLVGATVLSGFVILSLWQLFVRSRQQQPAVTRAASMFSMKGVQQICDAAGLAAFTVSGFAVALSVGADPLWLWGPISAMLTAAGGGILRDMVRQSGKVGSLKDDFYAEVPLLWGLGLSLFLLSRPSMLMPEEIGTATIVTLIGAFLTRLLLVFLGVRAIPFRWPRDRSADDG